MKQRVELAKVMLSIYRTFYTTAPTYDHKQWVMTIETKSGIQVVEMSFLQRLMESLVIGLGILTSGGSSK